jgi:hypothetical protein
MLRKHEGWVETFGIQFKITMSLLKFVSITVRHKRRTLYPICVQSAPIHPNSMELLGHTVARPDSVLFLDSTYRGPMKYKGVWDNGTSHANKGHLKKCVCFLFGRVHTVSDSTGQTETKHGNLFHEPDFQGDGRKMP